MTPEREEALRLAREFPKRISEFSPVANDAVKLARALLALAADLEAAERERDEARAALPLAEHPFTWTFTSYEEMAAAMQAERNLATAREALERIARLDDGHGDVIARAAICSLDGEPTTQAVEER